MSKGEAKIKRGFKLSHQKLVLEVDIDRQSLLGYTDITVVPHSRNLPKIKLHCRQCHVTQVSVNGIDANFVRKNYLEKVVPDDEYDHDIKSFTARYKAALHASDQGDLIVELPPGVTIQESNDVGPGDGDSKLGNGGESHHVIRTHNFSPLIVRVHYQLVQPRAGAYFVLPTETAYPRRIPHMYTHNQDDNGARLWMPTVDHVGERCSWELEITVAQGQIAVASGELLEQVWADDEETKKTFYYKQSVPVPARAIAIAVGPFQVYPDPHVPSITHFCLPGRQKELQHTVDFLGKAYRFYEEYLHTSFPFESYKQVFVEDAYNDVSSCASLSICSSHLLHDETIIDQTLVTRRLLAFALAQQWFQCYVGVKSWPDMWISVGFAGHLSGLYFRRMFGNNEYRYRLMMESEWVCAADSGPPLYNEHAAHPHDMQTELVARKAPLVVYMMERRVGETSFRKLLNGLVAVKPTTITAAENKEKPADANGIPPAPTSAKESVDQTLSTKKLLKTIKLETGQDMKSFAEKWIYSKGCPKFVCGFWFNRKRHQTEFALRQTNKPEDRISSSLTIRINELDGSYDNVIQFDEEMHAYEFPCYSRVRKSRKKKKDGDDKETEAPVVTTAPGAKKTETPLLWVRIDPDMEWIHNITFKQPEYMWVHQLEEDRDVVAQHEAIRGLQLFATSNALGALNRVVNNALVFYRVRMEAAYSLSSPSSSTSGDQPSSSAADVHWIGLDHLLRTFKNLFYNPDGTQLLPNTFADFCNYHLQKILPLAMAQVQDKEGRTPSDVLEFLLDLLKNNDNSLNSFSDNYYLESVLLAVSKTNTTGLSDTDKIAKQIHRYLNMERLMPSYHNTVTVACVKALGDLQCARKLDASSQVFRDYARYGHFDEVRIAASTALARLGFTQLKDPGIADKLLTFAESDPSPRIRARVLDILASPVASEERAFFDALYPSMDRLWALVNGPITALDSRVRGAALRLHQAVLAWGKQYGVVPDMPSHIPIPQRNTNIKVRAVMRGDTASAGPGKKLLPKSKSSSKRKQEEAAPPSEPLKIIFKTSEGSPPTTTSHNPPASTTASTPQPTTPPLSSSSSSTPAPKRRKHSSATPTAKTPQTSPAPSPAPSPSLASSHLPTIKEEPPTPPQPKATQPKRTPPPSAPQPLSPPPSTPSHPPPARANPPQTPTPTPPPSSTPSTPLSSSANLPPSTPSSTTPSPSPSPAPGSLKIKLKLGGVRLQDPQKK